MSKGAGRQSRGRFGVAALVVVAALLLLVTLLTLTGRPEAAVSVELSTDEEEKVCIYDSRGALPPPEGETGARTVEVDLAQWEGMLVRLDIRAGIGAGHRRSDQADRVAVHAEVVAGDTARPVEFVGWRNDGSVEYFTQDVGSFSLVAPGSENHPFVYGENDLLWHVLRVPGGGRLRLTFKRVPAGEIDREPEAYVPSVTAPRRLKGPGPSDQPERRPDVFIYLIDALRADHLGCYGYRRGTSPNIDAFAASSILYEEAHTAVTWTRPSVATILTGLYPSAHGVVRMESDKLSQWPVLLPEALKTAGYHTCCISTNRHVTPEFGFNQGFDKFVYKNMGDPDWANEQADGFLQATSPDAPVFLYVHTVEPHSPYAPRATSRKHFDRGIPGTCDGSVDCLRKAGRLYPKLSAEDIEHLIDLYDAEVWDNDDGFGAFLRLIERHGRLGHALIILLADHGEGFAEHDTIEHGWNLNREEQHVPLIVRLPGQVGDGSRVGDRVSLVDVFPTVLSVTGVTFESDYGLPGSSLREPGLVTDGSERGCRTYAELSHAKVDLVGVIDEDGYKRVIDLSGAGAGKATAASVGMWDTREDLAETTDLAAARPVRAAYCEQLAASWLVRQNHWRDARSAAATPAVVMTEELEKELRALGYLD